MTKNEIELCKQAMAAARSFEFRVGDTFNGAIPEAERLGYEHGTLEYNIFVSFYIRKLKELHPNGILLDSDDKITY